MKFTSALLLSCLLVICCSFKYNNKQERLCKDNEEIVFSCLLASNHKVVSVCRDKDNKYIVYRFGTKNKIELEYPAQQDERSWLNFKFYYVHRGGGKKNAGFGDVSLSFTNNNVQYNIYHSWRDEDETNELGIEVTVNGKVTKLKGDLNSQIGALQELVTLEDKITNSAEE
jgi:hypothetical protein